MRGGVSIGGGGGCGGCKYRVRNMTSLNPTPWTSRAAKSISDAHSRIIAGKDTALWDYD